MNIQYLSCIMANQNINNCPVTAVLCMNFDKTNKNPAFVRWPCARSFLPANILFSNAHFFPVFQWRMLHFNFPAVNMDDSTRFFIEWWGVDFISNLRRNIHELLFWRNVILGLRHGFWRKLQESSERRIDCLGSDGALVRNWSVSLQGWTCRDSVHGCQKL
jgi:hypothetical protein